MADLNACSSRKLSSDAGISASMANKIVKFRKREAKIHNFSELWKVKGMNRSIINNIKSNFKINRSSAGATGNTSFSSKRSPKQVETNITQNNRRVTYLQDQENQTDDSYMSTGMVDTPITVILPVCRSTKADDIQIVVPQMLQTSPSGSKLTAVYQMTPRFKHTSTPIVHKVKLEGASTFANPPSMYRAADMSAVVASSLSSTKEQSIRNWLNKIPRSPSPCKQSQKASSSDRFIENEVMKKTSPRKGRSRSRSKSVRRQQRSKTKSASRSSARKRPMSKSRSRSKCRSTSKGRSSARKRSGSKSRSRSKYRSTSKGRSSVSKRKRISQSTSKRKNSIRSSRQSSQSLNLRSADRKLRSTAHKGANNVYSFMETPKKKTSRKSKQKVKAEKSPNNQTKRRHDGPLSLQDLEHSDSQDYVTVAKSIKKPQLSVRSKRGSPFRERTPEKVIIRREHKERSRSRDSPRVSRDVGTKNIPKPIFSVGSKRGSPFRERTPEKVIIRREHKERSRSRDSPRVSRNSTWQRNEEWHMRRSDDEDRQRRHLHRHHKNRDHRRHRHEGDNKVSGHQAGCVIL